MSEAATKTETTLGTITEIECSLATPEQLAEIRSLLVFLRDGYDAAMRRPIDEASLTRHQAAELTKRIEAAASACWHVR